MDQLEPILLACATARDLVDVRRGGQIGQMLLQGVEPCRDFRLGRAPGQGREEPEVLHRTRIPPGQQQHLVPMAQARHSATRQFGLQGRRAEPVEIPGADPGPPLPRAQVSTRNKRQKPGQRRELHPLAAGRGPLCNQGRGSRHQIFDPAAVVKTKRRFRGAVKAVFARCHRDVMQTGHMRLRQRGAADSIPARPGRAGIGQRSFWAQRRKSQTE